MRHEIVTVDYFKLKSGASILLSISSTPPLNIPDIPDYDLISINQYGYAGSGSGSVIWNYKTDNKMISAVNKGDYEAEVKNLSFLCSYIKKK